MLWMGDTYADQKRNALLTEIGPNTSMGDLFRHYWMPALLSEE